MSGHPRSARLYLRAARVVAGAVQTASKRQESLYGTLPLGTGPLYAASARGAVVTALDGRRYADFLMALGAVALGYREPAVEAAVRRQMRAGPLTSLSSPLEAELAERVRHHVPCAERVRFLKTGAEAVAAAVRIARTHTGREHLMTCGYHGWLDGLSVGPGVPRGTARLIHPFRFNDPGGFERAFDRWRGRLAAVLMEPVVEEAPTPEFLRTVRERTRRAGVPLVFDEIKTGFRLGLSGAQGRYGVVPDLAVLGKAMANGYPLAAVTGRSGLMAAAGRTWISSTYASEGLSLAAALAALGRFEDPGVRRRLAEAAGSLHAGLAALLAGTDAPVALRGIPEMLYLRPRPGRGREAEAFLDRWQRRGLAAGLLLKRSAYNYPSAAHTPRQVALALEVAAGVLRR